MTEGKGFQLGTIAALSLSVVSSVSIVICNKALMSSLHFIFGHFLLTNLLMDTMKKTASKTKKEERIVNVASEAHRLSYKEGIRFDKINNEEEYKRWSAYGQSKLANVLHANELARRLKVLISAPEDINPRGLEFYFGINKGDLARCSVKFWSRWVELDWHSHMNQFSFPIPFKQDSIQHP